jgi:hypothetical protein
VSADQTRGGLQFDRAEPADGAQATATCATCGATITTEYYEVNGHIVCEGCRITAEEQVNAGGGGAGAGRFLQATALGLLAAAAGFGIYYGIARLTGYEFGLVAIVVGLMVGVAVRRGSNGRGGWRYQLLAVFLTYTAIVSTNVPFLIEEFRKESRTRAATDSTAARTDSATPLMVALADSAAPARVAPVATDDAATRPSVGIGGIVIGLLALVAFFYAVPFLGGIQNIMGLVIIAIGLFEAWKINKRATLKINGPFRVAVNP